MVDACECARTRDGMHVEEGAQPDLIFMLPGLRAWGMSGGSDVKHSHIQIPSVRVQGTELPKEGRRRIAPDAKRHSCRNGE